MDHAVIRPPRTSWRVEWASNERGLQVQVRNEQDLLIDVCSRGNSKDDPLRSVESGGLAENLLRAMAEEAARQIAMEFRIPERNIQENQEILNG